MGPARGRPLLLQRTMTGDPTEGFPTTPNGEGRTDLPFPGRQSAESHPTSNMTIPRSGNSPTNQATMTIPPLQETPRSDANLPLERWRACSEVAQRQSELAGGQAMTVAGPCEALQHEPTAEERILMMDYAAPELDPRECLPPPSVVDGTWPRLPWPRPWPFHLRPPLTRRIGFTAS
jgi:hypothetical protein